MGLLPSTAPLPNEAPARLPRNSRGEPVRPGRAATQTMSAMARPVADGGWTNCNSSSNESLATAPSCRGGVVLEEILLEARAPGRPEEDRAAVWESKV